MKRTCKILTTLLIIVFCGVNLIAQDHKVEYSYDDNGNRTTVTLTKIRDTSAPTEEKLDLHDCSVKVYPVPWVTTLTLEVVDKQSYNYSETIYWYIYSSPSSILKTQGVLPPNTPITLGLGSFANGAYIIKFVKGSTTVSKTILKTN